MSESNSENKESYLSFGKKYDIGSYYQKELLNYFKDGRIAGMECTQCNYLYFPPKKICPNCHYENKEIKWQIFSGAGTVYSYTKIHFGPAGFEDDAPYTLVVAQLDEGPKLMAKAIHELKIGDKIKIKPKIKESYITLQVDM
ncbi:MAG: Zn-ribbon domain-containing OB-fold protein [Candidatus Hodarchaeales archaeon]|jgi:uncharacterized OB-fold protein